MRNPMDFTGRNVMITGAGQGIGEATARMVVELGGSVTLIDLNPETLNKVANDLPKQRVLVQPGSVTDRDFLTEAVKSAAERFGGVHGLVNNAGITRTAMVEKMTLAEWQAVIDVNLTGAFNCLQIVGHEMLARSRAGEENAGAIVNISSDAGRKGTMGQINYGAAKAGLLGMTMSAAREWARFGIRVNTVAYGVVATTMTEVVRSERFREQYLANIPMGRFLTAEEAPNAICFLLSNAATFITGQHLSVNGGSHMAS